jgi:hypothetical protein
MNYLKVDLVQTMIKSSVAKNKEKDIWNAALEIAARMCDERGLIGMKEIAAKIREEMV